MGWMSRSLAAALMTGVAMVAPVWADNQAKPVSATHAWSRATPATIKMGAAYVTLTAAKGAVDRLIGVSSPAAELVEVHGHMMSGGQMSMAKLDSVEIPAGETVKFKPGGLHLMLIGLRRQLKEGTKLTLQFEFAKSGKLEVEADILPAWSLGPDKPN